MPVRIYEISKKLGLENKEILAAAKALGIAAAKVPSSSLDKITAEYLEEEILKSHPDLAARLKPSSAPAPEPKPAPVEQKIEIIKAPEPPPAPVVAEPPAPEPVVVAPEAPVIAEAAPVAEATPIATAEPATPVAPPAPVVPPKPVEPPKPQVGEKVGFIQLTPRPQPKAPEPRGGSVPPAGRPAAPGQTSFLRRGGDTGQFRRGPGQGGPGGQRFGGQQQRGPGGPSRSAEPAKPG